MQPDLLQGWVLEREEGAELEEGAESAAAVVQPDLLRVLVLVGLTIASFVSALIIVATCCQG